MFNTCYYIFERVSDQSLSSNEDTVLLFQSNIFLQSSVDHESSLTAHINYGYISSTNSLLRSSLGDCHDVLAQILPHEMLETTGPVSRQHGVVENQASATTVECTLKSRKRKRISCSGIIKRPRSLYDQVHVNFYKYQN